MGLTRSDCITALRVNDLPDLTDETAQSPDEVNAIVAKKNKLAILQIFARER
jgi:hypothetical protein